MKLKKAIKIAKAVGYEYVAVDSDGSIYLYNNVPYRENLIWDTNSVDSLRLPEKYTGKKDWKDTFREVS